MQKLVQNILLSLVVLAQFYAPLCDDVVKKSQRNCVTKVGINSNIHAKTLKICKLY